MARIRTIKPEFFTSEDIVSLTPHARLLYIAMWCEADKEGRMTWRPKTLKMRYFPADDVCIDSLCAEIVDLGLVRLYGEGYACIPTFHAHQHINPRESVSQLPTPPDQCKTSTRGARVKHASVTDETRDSDAQVGREGKGREGLDAPPSDANKRGHRLPQDWQLPKPWGEWALIEFKTWTVDVVRVEAEKFRDFWVAKAGKDAAKLDWNATWRNWCRNARPDLSIKQQSDQFKGAI